MKGALVLLAVVAACAGEPQARAASADSLATARSIPDSMVGSQNGYQFWFTLSRPASDTAGQACLERGLEIRTDSSRRLVPLLYTREAPVAESDSTALVHLSRDCQPGDLYRIDLRTAQPVRAR